MSPELRLHRPGREEGAFWREGTVQTKVCRGGAHPGTPNCFSPTLNPDRWGLLLKPLVLAF